MSADAVFVARPHYRESDARNVRECDFDRRYDIRRSTMKWRFREKLAYLDHTGCAEADDVDVTIIAVV